MSGDNRGHVRGQTGDIGDTALSPCGDTGDNPPRRGVPMSPEGPTSPEPSRFGDEFRHFQTTQVPDENPQPISRRLKLRRLTSIRAVRRARARVLEGIADRWVDDTMGRTLIAGLAELRRDIVEETTIERLPVLEQRIEEFARLPAAIHQHQHLHLEVPPARNTETLDALPAVTEGEAA